MTYMASDNIDRVRFELGSIGYSMTSFDELAVPFDHDAANELCELVEASEGSEEALKVVDHIIKNDMTIVQDARCLEIGRTVIQPAISKLFAENPDATKSWELFGLNRYRRGGRFGAHQDNVGKTVMVFTITGEREFTIYETPTPGLPDGTEFTTVENVFQAIPGTIVLLDPEKDPAHAVTATPSASIVAVADVPHKLRKAE